MSNQRSSDDKRSLTTSKSISLSGLTPVTIKEETYKNYDKTGKMQSFRDEQAIAKMEAALAD